MKKSKSLSAIILGIALCFILFTLSFYTLATSPKFYATTFLKLNVHETVGISEEDMTKIAYQITEYLGLKSDILQTVVTIDGVATPFYNPKERLHMEDVQMLFLLLKRVIYVFEWIALISLLWLIMSPKKLITTFKTSLFTALGLFGVFIAIALIDFESAFIQFHHLFFTNDLWLLDPLTDRLIQIMPIEFFTSFIQLWLLIVAIGLILITAITFGLKALFKKYPKIEL